MTLLLLAAIFYFVPFAIATMRGERSAGAIFVLNLLERHIQRIRFLTCTFLALSMMSAAIAKPRLTLDSDQVSCQDWDIKINDIYFTNAAPQSLYVVLTLRAQLRHKNEDFPANNLQILLGGETFDAKDFQGGFVVDTPLALQHLRRYAFEVPTNLLQGFFITENLVSGFFIIQFSSGWLGGENNQYQFVHLYISTEPTPTPTN